VEFNDSFALTVEKRGQMRESRIAGIWEAKMAILASSSLKRSRALPNCSREDRIRDGPFKCQG
jgi:hypothetical protein